MTESQPTRWRRVSRCLIPDAPPSAEIRMDAAQARALMRRHGAWMCRWTHGFDRASAPEGWFVVREGDAGLEGLSRSTRSKVRRALRRCEYRLTFSEGGVERWEILARDTGRPVGFAENRVYGDREVFYDRFGARRDALRGYYPLYGLIHTMNRHYLGERGMARVSDGFRTMRERSGVQEFLIGRFGFRRAGCDVELVYRPWFGILVRMLWAVRGVLPPGALRALARQHGLYGRKKIC